MIVIYLISFLIYIIIGMLVVDLYYKLFEVKIRLSKIDESLIVIGWPIFIVTFIATLIVFIIVERIKK